MDGRRAVRRVLGRLLGGGLRLWLATLRVTVIGRLPGAPVVAAFWHGQQLLLLAGRGGLARARVLVSWSSDGELQTGVLGSLGFVVLRGSSSRGAARGLKALAREVSVGHSLALSVDGPRGPVHVAKPGAAWLAAHTGAPLAPVAAAAHPVRRLSRTWDHFALPLPFARVVIAIGEPCGTGEGELDAALTALTHLAEQGLARGQPSHSMSFPRRATRLP